MPHPRKHWRRTKGRGQTPTGSMDLPIVNESARRTLHRPLTGNSNFYMRGGRSIGDISATITGIPGQSFDQVKQWMLVHGKPARKGFFGKLADIGETAGRAIGSQIKQHGLLSKAAGIAEAVTGGLPIASTVIGALGGGKRRRKTKRGGGYWPEYHNTMPYRKPYRDLPPYEGMTVPMKGGANRTMDMVMGYDPAIGKFRPMSQHQAVANRTHIL